MYITDWKFKNKGNKESFSELEDKILNLSNKVDTLSKESNKKFNLFENCDNSIQLLEGKTYY